MDEHTKHEHEFPERTPGVAYEREEENVRAVSSFGIGLAIGVVVVVFLMWGLFEWLYTREERSHAPITAAARSEHVTQLPPEPRLQASPRLDIQALREGEDQILGTNGEENEKKAYAWVDPNRGVARIPIDQAITILAAKGLPTKATADLPDAQGYREIPSKASSGRTYEKISQ